MKKGTISLLTQLVAGAVTLIILLIIGWTVYTLLSKGALAGQCKEAVLLYSGSKVITAGFGEGKQGKCVADRPTITAKELDDLTDMAQRAIGRYIKTDSPAASYFSLTAQSLYEWSLEKIMADQMARCQDTAWYGGLDIQRNNKLSAMLAGPGSYLCVLCARVKFGQSVIDIFGSQDIFVMKPWLDANNKFGKTYTAFLTENIDPWYQQYVVNRARFNISRTAAVVFVAGTKVESGTPFAQAKGGVGIFDYNTLTSNLGWNEYSALGPVKTSAEVPAKCVVIIGD